MKQLYDVTFTFDPADFPGPVDSVGLRGEFLFYKSGLTGHTDQTGMVDCTEKFPPSQYRDDLDNIGGAYFEPMEPGPDGVYRAHLRLPAGLYPYCFVINPRLTEPATDPRFAWSNLTLPDGTQKGLENLEEAMACGFTGPVNHLICDPKNPPVAPTVTGPQQNSEHRRPFPGRHRHLLLLHRH